MSERNPSIGQSGGGLIQAPVSRPRGSNVGDASTRLPEAQSRKSAPKRDPYNLRAAFDRLAKLLTRDTEGKPRADVPQRGYYLNILV
ncbi:hypothetical protein [Curvivirga aplysinae]|uniref:hypothetical protein n=1 Tax=Curvivirga aplysinae TaxID=2529852 RepID=UPI0012BC0489|nr:hypothetical protein [Curvivirga aplysinae]MTI09587.1 hypothetical protein [Curvivirga aplysinae]